MRGNPRLVARHALSSSTQAQILTAATFTSGVQLKIDNVEEGERKIPATVQAALRNVISHHPSTAPRSKQLTRTQGCQTVPVEGVALSTTAVQTEYVNEEIKKVNELVEEVMDTRDEDITESCLHSSRYFSFSFFHIINFQLHSTSEGCCISIWAWVEEDRACRATSRGLPLMTLLPSGSHVLCDP